MPTRANRKPARPLLFGTCAVLLAACSEASPAPSPTTSPRTPVAVATSPSATPVPTPPLPEPAPSPTPPPEMARADEAGAVAAVTYFLTDLYAYTLTSQETVPWLEMSHADCIYCSSIASSVSAERAAGVRTTPGQIAVSNVTAEAANTLTFGVKFEISIGPSVQRSLTGERVGEVPAQLVAMGAITVWEVDHWLIRGVDVFETEDLD